jgi:hyperosmotically inducible protein
MLIRKPIGTALMLGVIALSVAACEAVSGRETFGQYIDDTTISTNVRAKIDDDPELKPFEISVETMQGVVQLSGFVDSSNTKSVAGHDAMVIEGVHEVHNNLIVR